MSGFLARVGVEARARVAAAAAREPLAALERRAAAAAPPPSFATALRGAASAGVAVIAEVKRASPSRGAMAAIPDPAALARAYAAGGAAAVSVLTEPAHFEGSLEDLVAVVGAVPQLPVLRKDFIVDTYQVAEARAAGAAAVLLIVAALGDDELVALLTAAAEHDLDALVEIHDADELRRASAAFSAAAAGRELVIGVNARDLSNLTVDSDRFAALAGMLPPGAIAVAESGIRDADDVARLVGLGAHAVLVGEHVATAKDPAAAVAALRGLHRASA